MHLPMRRLHLVGLVFDVEGFWGLRGGRDSHSGGHCSLIKCCGGHLWDTTGSRISERALFLGSEGRIERIMVVRNHLAFSYDR